MLHMRTEIRQTSAAVFLKRKILHESDAGKLNGESQKATGVQKLKQIIRGQPCSHSCPYEH